MHLLTREQFAAMLAAGNIAHPGHGDTTEYLSRPQVAERIGVKTPTLCRYTLPPADAQIGKYLGWHPETIDAWNAARRSRRTT